MMNRRTHLLLWVTALAVGVAGKGLAQPSEAPPPAETPAAPTPVQPEAQAAPEPAPDQPAPDQPAPAQPAPAQPAPAPQPVPAPAPEPAPVGVEVGVSVQDGVAVESAGAGDEDPPADEEEIVITGSRIKRNSFDAPTPVQVFNREDLLRSGASNMGDLIRLMTANSGSETAFGLGEGSVGSANFNLRGLGIANTLVLLNGRRLVNYPDSFGVANSASFSDVTQIPLQFIERIEVAKGGASAIYGSDAIAGVVNIILRKDFNGFEITARGQATDTFDQQDGEVAAIWGAESEDSSITAQVSYFRRSPMRATDRDFTEGTMLSTIGQPGTFLPLGATNAAAIGEAMAMFPDDPSMWPDPVIGVVGVVPDPDCEAEGSDSILNDQGRCVFNFRRHWNLVNQERRILAHASAEHRPSDMFQIFGEFGFARKETVALQSPSYPLLRNAIVPANHPDNLDGRTSVFLGRPFGTQAGTAYQNIDVQGYRVVGGLRGELDEIGARDWSWEASFTWHRNEFTRQNEDILTDRFQDAVNSCSDPNDLSGCFNPYYSAVTGEGTTNSAEVVDFITGQFINTNVADLMVGDANIGGPLAELPGGDLAIAVGAQWRRTRQTVTTDNDAGDGAYSFIIGGDGWRAKQNVIAGYAELSVPAFEGFELQGAVRAEHYVNIETTVNPRVAMTWRPAGVFEMPEALDKLRIRGSVGTAFRAPNLLQTNGTVTALEQFQDPGPVFRGAVTEPNEDLKPETSVAFNAGLEWLYEGFKLEGDYWQYNISDLIVRESAQQVFAECRAQASEMGVGISQVPGCGDRFTATTGDPDAWQSMQISYINGEDVSTNGIDLAVQHKLEAGDAGSFTLGVGGSYVLSYNIPSAQVPTLALEDGESVDQDGCDGDECDIAGKRNQNNFARPLPRLRMRPFLLWMMEGHSAILAMNYISGYDDDANFDAATGDLDSISAWATVDLNYTYMFGETPIGTSTGIQVGINNLLDTDPPSVANTNFGYDIFTHDARGRLLYANLTHKF